MIDGKLLIEELMFYAKTFLSLNVLDEVYVRNTLLHELKLNAPTEEKINEEEIKNLAVPDVLIEKLKTYAQENSIADGETECDLFACYIMGIITPRPSEINRTFMSIKENLGPVSACEYLYNMSVKNYYIRKTAIDKNIMWEANDLKIPLEITINLSKPEKNNKDIAKLLSEPKSNKKYPACPLCIDNEGFYGSLSHPPRSNIRTVKVNLGGEDWYMQYSPYMYFDEHCILFNEEHTPMCISPKTIEKLLDFIELFPNYFIGSNSDLPIVGGSILNHEHYQGGKHLVPLQKSSAIRSYKSSKYADVCIDVLDFYNSVVRIYGFNRNTVQSIAGDVITAWKTYTDEKAFIFAETDGVKHNTVTPIARFLDDGKYCVELILRNNLTSDEYPDGIYHAHPEYHNIKKEGIGLIEAMGLYILPARLKRQFAEISELLVKNKNCLEVINDESSDLYIHRDMVKYLVEKYKNFKDTKKAYAYIQDYVNMVCANILINTSVYKKDNEGVVAFNKFLSSIEINQI